MTEHEFIKNLSHNLLKYRKINGFTQAELAELINYSGKSVSKWERGDGVPDTYTLILLSEIYDISIDELVGKKSECKKTQSLRKAYEHDEKERAKAKKRAVERAEKQKKKQAKKSR